MYSKLLFVVVGLAAVASAGSVALQCPKDNYYFTATGSQCEERGRQACAASLASCLNLDASKATLPVSEILAAAAAVDCTVFTSCVGKHMACIGNLARRAAADSEHACNEWGVALLSKMETVAHASEYEGSELQTACHAAVCQAQKMKSQVCPNMAEGVCFYAQSSHAGRRMGSSGTGSSMGGSSGVQSSGGGSSVGSSGGGNSQSSSSSSVATKQAVTVLAAIAALALLL